MKILNLSMATIIALTYSFQATAGSSSARQLRTRPDVLITKSVEQMTPQEIADGLQDIQIILYMMKQDLSIAQTLEDGRLSVKFRSASLSAAGIGVGTFLFAAAMGPLGLNGSGAAKFPAFVGAVLIGAGVSIAAAAHGIILLSPSEVKEIQLRIDKLEKVAAKLEAKAQAKAQAN